MSILNRIMGTAESTARGAARGGRAGARPTRGTGRPAVSTGRRFGRSRPAAPAPAGGLGGLVNGLLRRH